MSTKSKRTILLNAKAEAEASLTGARSIRDKWLAASRENPTNLTKKEVDHIGKEFRNRLLTLKWDCEDLEELVEDDNIEDQSFSDELKSFLDQCKGEIATFMNQLEEYETNSKIFNKHGITLPNQASLSRSLAAKQTTTSETTTATLPVTSITTNPISELAQHYERLSNDMDTGEIHFDKSLVEASTTIFNNDLYDHYEGNMNQDRLFKTSHATEVFNNLTRPPDVYTHPNENEMILEMLETEYYNPPVGLLAKTRNNYAIRKLFETDRNRFLGTIALIFSFPVLLILFLVI